jgi:6-phosphogluconate dehydrogenase
MQIGMIGLGRMGANMVRRLTRGGHECVVFSDKLQSAMRLSFGGHLERKNGE